MKTMLPIMAAVAVLALTAGAGVASANGGQPISKQDVASRIHNGLECLTEWKTLLKADGTSQFTSVLDCVLYAAGGGQFGTPPPAVVAPVVTGVSNDGSNSCSLVITGTGLGGATSVTVAGNAVAITSDSDTEITTSGVSTGGGDAVVVTTPGGQASGVTTYCYPGSAGGGAGAV
jgi:hypothetical protein